MAAPHEGCTVVQLRNPVSDERAGDARKRSGAVVQLRHSRSEACAQQQVAGTPHEGCTVVQLRHRVSDERTGDARKMSGGVVQLRRSRSEARAQQQVTGTPHEGCTVVQLRNPPSDERTATGRRRSCGVVQLRNSRSEARAQRQVAGTPHEGCTVVQLRHRVSDERAGDGPEGEGRSCTTAPVSFRGSRPRTQAQRLGAGLRACPRSIALWRVVAREDGRAQGPASAIPRPPACEATLRS